MLQLVEKQHFVSIQNNTDVFLTDTESVFSLVISFGQGKEGV